MKGQSDTPDGEEDNDGDEDDFRNVSYGNKVLVITGGVIMNAITGIIFFILAFSVFGVTFIAPEVGNVGWGHADRSGDVAGGRIRADGRLPDPRPGAAGTGPANDVNHRQ